MAKITGPKPKNIRNKYHETTVCPEYFIQMH